MPAFILTSQHNPENCPIHNEKSKETALKNLSILDAATREYGLKILGNYIVGTEHRAYFIFDAPTPDAFYKMVAEPSVLQWLSHNMTEIKFALTQEEAMKHMSQ